MSLGGQSKNQEAFEEVITFLCVQSLTTAQIRLPRQRNGTEHIDFNSEASTWLRDAGGERALTKCQK